VRSASLILALALATSGCRSRAAEPVPETLDPVPMLRSAPPAPIAAANRAQAGHAAEEVPAEPTRPRSAPGPWAHWPIPNFPSSGLPNPQSYDVSVAGIVSDRVTGLMWQRKVEPGTLTFDEANQRCSRLDLGGYSDWRLPSRIELVSILDLAETQPSIDRDAFPSTPSDWFWTASVASDSPTAAWYVYFYFGYPKTDERTSPFRARCVRSARAPAVAVGPDYEVRPVSVRDRATGLSWQRAVPRRSFSFSEASAYCHQLDLDGQTDWRLPSMPELESIVDERTANPAIDAQAFPETPADSFWTSSLFGNKSAEVWHVLFDHGAALYGLPKAAHRVRCVR
jgi:Protein of unknown function (DUF1566)